MTATATATARRIETIDRLLTLAENASTDHEAALAYAKATELMTKYQVDHAMIDSRRSRSEQTSMIIERAFWFPGVYALEHRGGAYEVLDALYGGTIRILGSAKMTRDFLQVSYTPDTRKGLYLYAVGFSDDLDSASMLLTSIQVQSSQALARWWSVHRHDPQSYYHDSPTIRRRSYIAGFYHGVAQAVSAARAAATADANAGAGGSNSMEVALLDRASIVAERMDSLHPNPRESKASKKAYSARDYHRGSSDGRNADTGTTRVQSNNHDQGELQ